MSITPFRRDGALDEQALRAHLRFLATGEGGVYVCSQGSGEGDLLTEREKGRIYEIAADELKGAVSVYAAGLGLAHSTDRVVQLAKYAQECGVDAVYVIAPRQGAFPPSDEELERYFRRVVESISCPVVIGNNVVLTGRPLPTELIERLVAEYPHISEVVVSDAAGPLAEQVSRLVESLGARVVIRVGISSQLLVGHALGAGGLLSYEGNIAPELAEQTWQALETGDARTALETFRRVLSLNVLCARFGNPRVLKDALRIIGRDGGYLREPYQPLAGEDLRRLAGGLRSLGFANASTVAK